MSRTAAPVALIGAVNAAWSDASDGDLRPAGRGDRGHALAAWASRTAGTRTARRVRWMEQVHGCRVLVAGLSAGAPGGLSENRAAPGAGAACAGPGDGLVSGAPDLVLTVLTADCASIALGSAEGVFGAVHAGWRGLTAGVVGRTVAAMRSLGATEVVGALGPCIHAECCAFSDEDLDAVVAACGRGARGETSDGRPALDLPAAVSSALLASGVRQVAGRDACTACTAGHFSHRARGDRGRQALAVWSGAGPSG